VDKQEDFSFYLKRMSGNNIMGGNSQYQLESPTFKKDNQILGDLKKINSSNNSYEIDI
jgi:hypothetical protein